MRATDHQKDAAGHLLNQAYAMGQLTQEELGERLDAAYATPVTVDALDKLLGDVATRQAISEVRNPIPLPVRPAVSTAAWRQVRTPLKVSGAIGGYAASAMPWAYMMALYGSYMHLASGPVLELLGSIAFCIVSWIGLTSWLLNR
jgi:hypothetical protein